MIADGDSTEVRARERRLVIAMFLAGAAVYIQAFDAQAILPSIAEDQGVAPTISVLVLSATTIGMALGVMPWAYASDRWGRLRVIRWCIIGSVLVSLITPLLPGFPVLLALRVVKGLLLGGVTGLAVALIFEQVRPLRAVIASGIYISGNTLGGVATRVLSGIIADVGGWRLALGVIAALSLVLALAFLLMTRGVSEATGRDAAQLHGSTGARMSLGRALLSTGVLLSFAQGFVALGVFNALFSVLPFRLHDQYPVFGAVLTSSLLGLYAVAFISAQSGGRLASRFGHGPPLALGYLLAVSGLAALFIPSVAAVAIGVAAAVLGIFLIHPLNSAEAGRRMPAHRAQSTALYQISWLAGATLVGPAASIVYESWGWAPTVWMLTGVLCLGAVAAIVDHRPRSVGQSI
ncbi:MFS transporter [Brachybacterium sp. AOP42-B2-9]|uniref:MFS transporter n=1 Tax=Brachybacterium sp. AOP42-B2-9 TaxID=3457672 RepID=UPI004034E130